MRRPIARSSAIALGATALLALAGCSSGGDDGSTPAESALKQVASSPLPQRVTYANATRVDALEKADAERYSSVSTLGSATLGQFAYTASTGIADPKDISETIVATYDGQSDEIWRGSFDTKHTEAQLSKSGYTRSKADPKTWTRHGGASVVTGGSELSLASAAGGLDRLHPKSGSSVADRKDSKTLAACLGKDPYYAEFDYIPDNRYFTSFALGEYATKPGHDTERLCVAAKSTAIAKERAAALRGKLAADRDTHGSKVSVLGGDIPIIKAVVPLTDGPEHLLRADWMASWIA